MPQILAILTTIRALLPIVRQLIEVMDEAMPDGTPGQHKLDTLKGMVEKVAQADAKISNTFELAWPMLSLLISGIVKARKTAPAPAIGS
jgi:hypothetical protein